MPVHPIPLGHLGQNTNESPGGRTLPQQAPSRPAGTIGPQPPDVVIDDPSLGGPGVIVDDPTLGYGGGLNTILPYPYPGGAPDTFYGPNAPQGQTLDRLNQRQPRVRPGYPPRG